MRLRTPFLITLKRVVETVTRGGVYSAVGPLFLERGKLHCRREAVAVPLQKSIVRSPRLRERRRFNCETKSRIPRESAECKAVRERHAETEKIETLGSSRMTKILEEIGAESDAGGIKGEEKKIVSAFV